MKTQKLFEDFYKLNTILEGRLVEISVRQHQIALVIDKTFKLSLIERFMSSIPSLDEAFLTFHDDHLYLIVEEINSKDIVNTQSLFYNFMKVIGIMSEEICQCPALEYVISSQYIKCYLDKNGLTVSDLEKYEEILESDVPAEIELHPQRPYVLFINMEVDDNG